jgi:hypothetical protein
MIIRHRPPMCSRIARDSSPLSEVPDDEDIIMHVPATPPLPHLFSMSGKLWALCRSDLRLLKIMIAPNSSALTTPPLSSTVVEQAVNVDDKVSLSSLNMLKSPVHPVVWKKSATLRDRNGVGWCASETASTSATTALDAKARPVK